MAGEEIQDSYTVRQNGVFLGAAGLDSVAIGYTVCGAARDASESIKWSRESVSEHL